jgi:hypothetical protein
MLHVPLVAGWQDLRHPARSFRVGRSSLTRIKAVKHCAQDFFTLWKDADPDIPILKEAKAKYAKIQ